MKHGLVTKIEKKFIIIKTDNNDIERLKIRSNIKVGDKIAYEKKDVYHGFNRVSYKQLGASLSMLLIIIVVTGVFFNQINENRVYGVVSYDVNPSLEITINKDNEVIEIINKKNAAEIIPDSYDSMNLSTLLNTLTKNAIDTNLLKAGDAIVIGYTPINNAPQTNEAVETYIQNNEKQYKILYIQSTQESYESIEDKSLAFGRIRIKEALEELDKTVPDNEEFINGAVEAIKDNLKDIDEHYELPETDEATESPEQVTEDNEVADVEEDKEEVQNNDAEKERKAQEEKERLEQEEKERKEQEEKERLEEEEALKEREALEADIEKQKTVVNEKYNAYLNKKAAADNTKTKMDNKASEIKDQNDLLAKKENDLNDIESAKKESENEKTQLESLINNDKKKELDTALSTYNDKLQSTAGDEEKVDTLRANATAIYNEAYNEYKPIADETIQRINQEVPENTDGTVNQEKEDMIQTVDLNQQPLEQKDYGFIQPYNDAFYKFQEKKNESDALNKQANDLESSINDTHRDAKNTYDQEVKTINDKYVAHESKLVEVNETIDGFDRVIPNFESNIITIKEAIDKLNTDYEELKKQYETLLKEMNDAYQIYLKEKEVLNELEEKL